MFRSIRSLPEGSYFVAECGLKGQLLADMVGYVKVAYLDRDGKRQQSEWSPGTHVVPCQPFPLSTAAVNDSEKFKPAKPTDAVTHTARGRRVLIVGKPVTPVVRWMGKQGWDFKKAKEVLTAHGVVITDTTIRCQLLAGSGNPKYVRYGEPASLTAEEVKALDPAAQAPAEKAKPGNGGKAQKKTRKPRKKAVRGR